MTISTRCFLAWVMFSGALCLAAESSSSSSQNSGSTTASAPVSVVTDPGYKLSVGDQISVMVYEEPQLNCSQLIDKEGVARLYWLGDTKLTGLTVREAEHTIESLYRERNILKKPVVTLVVTAFSPREVLVMGAVGSPGSIAFPRDATTLDISEVITRAGGFKQGAKANSVNVSHTGADGQEVISKVDVESMLSIRKRGEQRRTSFPIYPGDRINVDMSLF